MVRRHPHVFAGETAETPEQVLVLWNAAKAAEKRERRSVLDGVSQRMPSLALAQKLLGRRASVAPASPNPGDPAEPGIVDPPLDENPRVRAGGATSGTAPRTEAELGDALLALVTLARAEGWDAERALRERLRTLADEIRAAELLRNRGETGA
jgi:XTP/dITP diphosphohydrolase